jgi:hypothetical protein
VNLLAITRAAGMISVYGQDGYGEIQAKLAAFQRSIPGLNVTLAVLDDVGSMAAYGGVAAGADAISLQSAVTRVVAALPGGLTSLDGGLLILGGGNVVPFFQVPNPVTNRATDPDPWVYTDNPYGQTGPSDPGQSLEPSLAVGRICTGAGDPASAFCALIDNLITNHNARPIRAGYVEVTNRVWQDASASVASALAGAGRVLVCPDDRVTALNAGVLDCKYLYCNLHGFQNDPAWKGMDPVRGYVTALTPDSFSSQYVAGTFVYTDACYGLQTDGRPTDGSCALTLLAQGAAAVVGPTGLAYGTAPGAPLNLIDADALTRGFFNAALGGGTVGSCLKQARLNFLGSSSTMATDVYQQKTLLQFQLLGDPTLAIQ